MRYLKEKVDAGANLIFTQMFYDADVFINWGRQVRAAGITIPIVPGIMPIQTFASFKRRTAFSKTIIPPELIAILEPIQEDDKKVREFGTKFVADMVRRILGAGLGIHGIHCCTCMRSCRVRLTRGRHDEPEQGNGDATRGTQVRRDRRRGQAAPLAICTHPSAAGPS